MAPGRQPFRSAVSDVSGDELTSGRAGELRLHLEKALASPPERVFAAFVYADELRQWWGPDSFTVPHLWFDVAEGARYRITMQPPDGDAFHLGGTFRIVEPPGRLVFTFAWEEPDPDDQETLVTLSFDRAVEGTNLVLDQQPFKTEPRCELHRDGWTDTLERLARFLE
jgi:uncharacterized protein YndB with AHSA1/START domain